MFGAAVNALYYGEQLGAKNVVAFAAAQAAGLLIDREFKAAVAAHFARVGFAGVVEKVYELGFKIDKKPHG